MITSGARICQPDGEKRRKCQPACCPDAPYCHGRCKYTVGTEGIGCLFHPCSPSPYREDGGSSCSQLAMEAGEADGECHGSCAQVSTDTEADTCQQCLEDNIPSPCSQMSGHTCWHCSQRVLESLTTCSRQDPVHKINCIHQEQTARCQACTCTLLCYWIPGGDLCKACQEDPQFETMFVNSVHCPQGWTWAEAESKCVKSFSVKKPWSHASQACQAGGGKLATAKSYNTLQPLIEAMNLQVTSGEFWIGSRKKNDGDDYTWEDGTSVSIDNWDVGYPETGRYLQNHQSGFFHQDNILYQDHFASTHQLQMDPFAVQAATNLIITFAKSMKMLISFQQEQVWYNDISFLHSFAIKMMTSDILL